MYRAKLSKAHLAGSRFYYLLAWHDITKLRGEVLIVYVAL